MLPQLVTTGCHECLVFQRKNFTLAFSAAESVGIPSSLVSGLGFLTECFLVTTFSLAEAAWVTGRQPSTPCYDLAIATWTQLLPARSKKIFGQELHLWMSPKRFTMAATRHCSLLWSRPIALRSFATVIKWLAFPTSFWISTKWCTSSAVWLLHGWCHMKLLLSQCAFCVHHTTMYQFTVSLYSKPHT